MSRSLFDQSLASPSANRRPIGTVMLSVLLHAAALGVIVVTQLTAVTEHPAIVSTLRAFVRDARPPVPPPPPAPARVSPQAPALNPNIAPVVMPETFTPEPAAPPPPATSGVPGGLAIGPASDVGSLLASTGPIRSLGAPPPAPTPVVRPGGDLRPPTRIVYVEPVYPASARTARIEGVVILEATIDPTGAVTNVVVLRSQPLLDRAAIDAVSKWRYTPTVLNGVPVSVVMSVTVRFSLR